MFKPLRLVYLGQIEAKVLAQHDTADLLEMLLKKSRDKTFLHWLQEHPEAVVKMLDLRYGISSITYILKVESKYSSDALIQAIREIVPERKEDIMTAAQQVEQRGKMRGIQLGMRQGRHAQSLDIAKNMLAKLPLDMKTVVEATGLSEQDFIKL